MAFNSNGQISYLVLDSLSSGSKYGLEIIEYISKKTGGNYIMKKPTLYSCLTRMEKKGLVSSSYWGESELGGKRHYYSITNSGRANLEELSRLFANSNFDFAESTDDSMAFPQVESKTTENEVVSDEKPTILHQGNIFDLVKEQKVEPKAKPEQKSDLLENQIDIFNMEPIAQPTVNDAVFLEENERVTPEEQEKISYYQNKLEQTPVQEEIEKVSDGGKFLDESERLTPDQEEQNKRLYDTSSELKKYRKRKSFSENQIEMAVVYEDEDYDQIQKERIAELKKSLLNLKQNDTPVEEYHEEKQEVDTSSNQTDEQRPLYNRFDGFYTNNNQQNREKDEGILYETEYVEQTPSRKTPTAVSDEDEVVNDAIFITEPRMEEIPIQRKITPPNIEVSVYDNNLPAPKRDSELEPTYRDMMAKLFEKKKEKETKRPTTSQQAAQQPVIERFDNTSFADYSTLKRYYNSQGIAFKEYRKSNVERKHNTNLLNLISSSILLLLSAIGSAILFGIISGTHNLKSGTNFMFYTLPILFVVLVAVDFFILKFAKSKKAKLVYNDAVNWIVFVLGVIVVCIINICCKMQAETIAKFSTSLFVPILGLLLILPVNYYIRKFLYKRYAK